MVINLLQKIKMLQVNMDSIPGILFDGCVGRGRDLE